MGWSQVALVETGLPSPAEEPSLPEQPKDSLEDVQPTSEALVETLCLYHMKSCASFLWPFPGSPRKGYQL